METSAIKANNLVNANGAWLGLVNAQYVFFVEVRIRNFDADMVAQAVSVITASSQPSARTKAERYGLDES